VGKGSEHLIRSVLAHQLALPEVTGLSNVCAARSVDTLYEPAWQHYQRHYREINGQHSDVYPGVAEGLAQLTACFEGRLRRFDLPLDWGTGLHAEVRRAMAAIPWGETRTYGQIAKAVGAPAQAVGQACGANPLPIIIPCHRVTGTHWFGGFSAPGGVETKAALLRHEGALLI